MKLSIHVALVAMAWGDCDVTSHLTTKVTKVAKATVTKVTPLISEFQPFRPLANPSDPQQVEISGTPLAKFLTGAFVSLTPLVDQE